MKNLTKQREQNRTCYVIGKKTKNLLNAQSTLTVASQHYPLAQVTLKTDQHKLKGPLIQKYYQSHQKLLTLKLQVPKLISSPSSIGLLTVSKRRVVIDYSVNYNGLKTMSINLKSTFTFFKHIEMFMEKKFIHIANMNIIS